MKIRKLLTVVEEIQEDGGRRLEKPLRKVAAVAVIDNPFAGRFVEDLQELVKTGEELGDLLGRRDFVAKHPDVASRLLDRAAQNSTDALNGSLAAIAPLRFRVWSPAVARLGRKAHQLIRR